jgi:hypothetical protein
MTSYIIVVVLMGLLSAFLVAYVSSGIKPAFKKMYWVAITFTFVAAAYVGTGLGTLRGQRHLLVTKKSFYHAEVQRVSGYSRRGMRMALQDTVWKFNWDPRPVTLPITNPRWYMHGKDTLWSSAIFRYQVK